MNPNDLPDAYCITCDAWAAGLRRPPRITVSEWADQQRVLTESETSEPGQWRTDRLPFLREIMDNLSPWSDVQRVVFIKSTQVGGTECLINWIGAVMGQYGGPMLVVEPTIEVSELFSQQRLSNMLAASPSLSKRFGQQSRDKKNKALLKEFPGGILRLAGGNSAASLRSMPVKFLGLDEVDAYPGDLDGEGDPVGLAEERTNNFPRRKIFLISTPTIKDASRIETEYERSDQRRYHVPCPHCGEYQTLVWGNLKWELNEAGEVGSAWYVCRECGSHIEEHKKPQMLAAGRWVPKYPDRRVRGYHINSLYSPLGLGRSWKERAQGFLNAQGNTIELKRFVNTCLGETWEDRSSQVKANALQARAVPFKLRTIPLGCLLLTLGVDTQDDRLECQLLGWGRGETCWVLDYHVIWGNPSLDETWEKLTHYRQQAVLNQFGIPMKVMATAIDSGGHHTHDVYNYVRWWQHERVIAVKGVSTPNKAVLGKPTLQDVDHKGQLTKNGVQLWPVGTDTAKSTLMGRLISDGEAEITAHKVRFSSDLTLEYYDMLTAEVFDPERNKWVKRKGKRNEALDTWVYGYAAALHPDLRIHACREWDWQQLENMLQPRVDDLFGAAMEPSSIASQPLTDKPPEVIPETQHPPDGGFFNALESDSKSNDDWLAGRADNWLE
ncbi:phage terminase large subunit family protein [Deefgea piscis]|uniref:phage terminase large subunit family protein n=1 Tax=Deefgea piscis TaxID=2739061 RepID=UPI001C7E76EE|nr:phage terminase large subunit family protein [Deefgea piscis]QZA80192.1 phage terminase large subunit family protein [Deefgea piscis]